MTLEKCGYLHRKAFLTGDQLALLRKITARFHQSWSEANRSFYESQAINAAYLTGKRHLSAEDRVSLFQFLASDTVMQMVSEIVGTEGIFINSQLFFDPVHRDQKNYWHRDTQYGRGREEEQQALKKGDYLHFRCPLYDEPGIEVIPGSHLRWDTEEEYAVRMETDGRHCFDDLKGGRALPLSAGDVLIFSGKLIHRGLYGKNRLSLDLLFSKPDPSLLDLIEEDCLPEDDILPYLENPSAFLLTKALKAKKTLK